MEKEKEKERERLRKEGAELHNFLFAQKCHGNAESDIGCKYGNAISIFGHFPVKLKLLFFSGRARKAEKKNR